jgi:hypothetical protein
MERQDMVCQSGGSGPTNAAAEKRMTKVFQRFTKSASFPDLVYQRKLLAMQISLSGEVSLLEGARRVVEMHRMYVISRETCWLPQLETIACFPVYRTYISRDEVRRRQTNVHLARLFLPLGAGIRRSKSRCLIFARSSPFKIAAEAHRRSKGCPRSFRNAVPTVHRARDGERRGG